MPSSTTWLASDHILRMTLENGNSIDLQGALYGMNAQIYFDHGAQGIDLESWVSENLRDAVTLDINIDWEAAGLAQPITNVFSGAGADLIFGGIYND